MADHIGGKVREWIAANVHNYPLHDQEEHLQRLVLDLTDHMEAEGYTRQEVEDHLGDLDEYVEEYFRQVQDPDLGFKEPPFM